MFQAPVLGTERGRVVKFNAERKFGFIASDSGGADLFVHARAVRPEGGALLAVGELVMFDRVATEKGYRAENVRRL